MAYRRPTAPVPRPSGAALTRRLGGVGFALAARADRRADIEVTLVHASELGMDEGDLRTLSVLTTWLGTHERIVCVDRLRRFLVRHPSSRVRAYWASLASAGTFEERLAPLVGLHEVEPVDLLPAGTAFQLRRKGRDTRFDAAALRVPAGALRHRESDVAAPEDLAPRHRGYALRLMMGASYRAVLWDLLEHDPSLTPSEAGRLARSSFSTAWEAVRDFRLVKGVPGARAARTG